MTNFEDVRNIAYLEPVNSYSAMATDEFCRIYNINGFPTPFKTIKQIVDFVGENPDSLGVLPVENTQDGTIREAFDCIMTSENPNVRIISELLLPVEYCLLARTTEIYSINNLIATPRLIAKCQNFINNCLPMNKNVIETATMFDAANELRNYNLTYASIGNRKIAESCMLNILNDNINDDPNNKTKYILIGDMETQPTGKDRTTIAFKTNHTPGALLKILTIFLENNINLTYISSQPSKNDPNEYTFIVNFDGHIQGSNLLKAINEIKPKTSFFRYLGSYKTGIEIKYN